MESVKNALKENEAIMAIGATVAGVSGASCTMGHITSAIGNRTFPIDVMPLVDSEIMFMTKWGMVCSAFLILAMASGYKLVKLINEKDAKIEKYKMEAHESIK